MSATFMSTRASCSACSKRQETKPYSFCAASCCEDIRARSSTCVARTTGTDGLPQLDDTTLMLPGFRGDLPPDVTFVGFPIDPDELYETTNPWWFVIAQPPAEPRFGLDDWSATTPALPMTANELAWNHMAVYGNPTTETDFAIADPQVLRGRLIDGMGWGGTPPVKHSSLISIRCALPFARPTCCLRKCPHEQGSHPASKRRDAGRRGRAGRAEEAR